MFFGSPSSPHSGFPQIAPKLAWPARDVVLIDLARHALMRASLFVGEHEAELHEALKAEADRLGAEPDAPEPALDALEPFALAWARERAAHHRRIAAQEV